MAKIYKFVKKYKLRGQRLILKEGVLKDGKLSLRIPSWHKFYSNVNLSDYFGASNTTTIHKLRFLVFESLLDATKKIEMSFLSESFCYGIIEYNQLLRYLKLHSCKF